jgi:hypothetical protein
MQSSKEARWRAREEGGVCSEKEEGGVTKIIGGFGEVRGDDNDGMDACCCSGNISMQLRRGWWMMLHATGAHKEIKGAAAAGGLSSALIHGRRFAGGGMGVKIDNWMVLGDVG